MQLKKKKKLLCSLDYIVVVQGICSKIHENYKWIVMAALVVGKQFVDYLKVIQVKLVFLKMKPISCDLCNQFCLTF